VIKKGLKKNCIFDPWGFCGAPEQKRSNFKVNPEKI